MAISLSSIEEVPSDLAELTTLSRLVISGPGPLRSFPPSLQVSDSQCSWMLTPEFMRQVRKGMLQHQEGILPMLAMLGPRWLKAQARHSMSQNVVLHAHHVCPLPGEQHIDADFGVSGGSRLLGAF